MSERESSKLTLRQIAKLAGTSKSTVSRVLTNHPSVSPDTRARVEEVIAKSSFRPNIFARGLAGGRSGLIAVISRHIESGYYAEVIRGINDEAGEHKGHLLSSLAHSDEDYVRLWRDFASGGLVDGVVLIAPPANLFDEEVEPGYVPAVLCSHRTSGNPHGWDEIDSVTVTNRESTTELLNYLMEKGCKRFVYLSGDREAIYDARERALAVEAFKASHPDLHIEIIGDAHTTAMAKEVTSKYVSRHKQLPDVFIAFNDRAAIGVWQALRDAAITVPEDSCLAGCDDDDVAEIMGLTTLHMPMKMLGRQAVKLLLRRVNEKGRVEPKHEVISMALEIRATSTLR